jgi:hypothetical protein
MLHPRDKMATNPRIQCSVCGEWKRQRSGDRELFYGSCRQNSGGDHLVGNSDDQGVRDVCAECCDTQCKRAVEQKIAAALARAGG